MKRFLKSSFSIFLAITMIFSSAYVGLGEVDFSDLFAVKAIAASSGTCGDNLKWTLDDEGTLTISGTGDMYSYSSDSMPWYSFRTNIKSVVINDGVTSIGGHAFHGCTSLTSIKIPDSVTNISSFAFAFCDNLTSIIIPDSVTSIGDSAFYGCHNLTSVTIGNGVTSISSFAFGSCASLTTITIPDSVTSIGWEAFSGCSKLTTISIPDSVTSIGEAAFLSCNSLASINVDSANNNFCSVDGVLFNKEKTTLIQYPCRKTDSEYIIPYSVTNIGGHAFHGCKNLVSVAIPDSVTSIGRFAFEYCNSLTSVTIPDSATSIGNSAFRSCKSLTSINVDSANNNYCSVDGVLFDKDKTTLIQYPCRKTDSEYRLPDSVTSISYGAFDSCDSLTTITIPDSVISIGDSAFYRCTSLSSVTIGNGVTSIGDFAFGSCDSLTTITIPDSVTSIGVFAFCDCSSLTSITIPDSVTSIGDSAFDRCYNLKYVFYKGTESDWSGINIDDESNYHLTNSYIHYQSVDHTSSDWIVDKEPTCASGEKHKECIICGAILETKTLLPIAEHTASDWIIDKDATCTENGSKYIDCTVCGETLETTTIHATGHTEVFDKAVAPTCTKTGLTKGSHCSECNKVIVAQEVVSANGHTESEWITDKKATVYKAGSKHKECTECGETLETATIKQLKCSKPKLKSIENTEYGVLTKWSSVSGADKYDVYRKTGSSGKYSKIGTTSKTYYTDKKASSGKKYYYYVKAVNEAGSSEASSSKSIYYLADTTLSTPKSTKSGITLKWKKITGADGYMVYRKTGSGSYSKIATVKGNSKVTYTDKSAKKGKKYTYKIKAYKSKTYSAYSNAKSVTDKY